MSVFYSTGSDADGDSRGDQREAHDSGSSVSLEALKDFGVTYRQIPIDDEGKWENEISESHQC